MHQPVSSLSLSEYAQSGVAFPIALLDEAEVAYYRSQFYALQRSYPEPTTSFRLPYLHLAWAYQLATHPTLLHTVRSILGPDIIIAGGIIIAKPAHSPDFVSWHQDSLNHFFSRGGHSLSAWIALSSSTAASGCMRVLPGTHTHRYTHTVAQREGDILRKGRSLTDVDTARAADLVLQPGEMSLHHMNIIHGSLPNTSDADRIGFIVRYASSDIRLDNSEALGLAKKNINFDRLGLRLAPPTRNDRAAIERQRALDRHILTT